MTKELKPDEQTAPDEGLEILDDLISEYYLALKDKVKHDAKLGDFLKMLELRRKLAPENQEKTELWNLLRKIRNESLKDHPITTTRPTEPGDPDEEVQ